MYTKHKSLVASFSIEYGKVCYKEKSHYRPDELPERVLNFPEKISVVGALIAWS